MGADGSLASSDLPRQTSRIDDLNGLNDLNVLNFTRPVDLDKVGAINLERSQPTAAKGAPI
jgi:hypothetical protein